MPNRVPMLRRAAALVFCGVLALSACGGEEAANPKPLPTIPGVSDNGGADVARPSDGGGGGDDGDATAAPAIPAPDPADYPGMDENTEEGAKRATEYFGDVLLWSYQSGDTRTLKSLYSPECDACQSQVDHIGRMKRAEHLWPALMPDPVSTVFYESRNHDGEVAYVYDLPSFHSRNVDTGANETHPELAYMVTVALDFEDNAWVVKILELDSRDLES